MITTRTLLPAVAACLLVSRVAAAQMPPMPKPGPEHQIFTMEAGTWDAVVEMAAAPGSPATTSKGSDVVTLACGGLCIVNDFNSELIPGMPFNGHGMTAYDPAKKKYVGSWTDSMSAGLLLSEGTYDAATKTVTSWMEAPGPTGATVKTKSTVQYTDADHRVMTMYVPGPDGKDMQTLKISYTRRK
jgi:Protein of unknown function (DUF1579)